MKLAPEFQRHSLQDPSPELLEQLGEAVEVMNQRLVGHDYIRPLLFVIIITKPEGEEATMDFNVYERPGIGSAKSQFKLSVDEMAEAKAHPLDDHARLFFITPEARGACDVRVAAARTPRAPVEPVEG